MNTLELSKLKEYLLQEIEEPIEYLYHATYKKLLKSIKEKGLDTSKSKKAWEDSIPGYVYLAKDPDVAISYAESSDVVPEEWIDEIVLITIDKNKLDQNKLYQDSNVRNETSDTLEYKGVISPNAFVSIKKVNDYQYENIQEIGDASSAIYDPKQEGNQGKLFSNWKFTTDSGIKYHVSIFKEFFDDDNPNLLYYNIGFGVEMNKKDTDSGVDMKWTDYEHDTNDPKNILKVMASVIQAVKKTMIADLMKGKRVAELRFTSAKSKDKDTERNNRRTNLYKAYIKKQLPNSKVVDNSDESISVMVDYEDWENAVSDKDLQEIGKASEATSTYDVEQVDFGDHRQYQFTTDSGLNYAISIDELYPDPQVNPLPYPILLVNFGTYDSDNYRGIDTKTVHNKGELYRVMNTIAKTIIVDLNNPETKGVDHIAFEAQKREKDKNSNARENVYIKWITARLGSRAYVLPDKDSHGRTIIRIRNHQKYKDQETKEDN